MMILSSFAILLSAFSDEIPRFMHHTLILRVFSMIKGIPNWKDASPSLSKFYSLTSELYGVQISLQPPPAAPPLSIISALSFFAVSPKVSFW
jgi:hypothetical protein